MIPNRFIKKHTMPINEIRGSEEEKHKCTAERVGDWVIYRCPICPDYQRRVNLKTGKMKSTSNIDNPYLHSGTLAKPGFDMDISPPN